MSEKTTSRILLISAIPAILLMAFLFDLAVAALAQQNAEGAGWEPVLIILYPLFELVIVLGALGLFWYLFRTEPRSTGISITLTVVGFIVLFSTPLLFFLPFPVSWMALVDFFRPGTYMFQAGALMGGAGLLSLVIKDGRLEDDLVTSASGS
jgi:hypothetical protein